MTEATQDPSQKAELDQKRNKTLIQSKTNGTIFPQMRVKTHLHSHLMTNNHNNNSNNSKPTNRKLLLNHKTTEKLEKKDNLKLLPLIPEE